MKTYLRCVWANKFTLAGWSMFFIACVLLIFDTSFGEILGVFGLFTLMLTTFGIETMHAYHSTYRAGLQLSELYAERWTYCYAVGFRLAQRDLLRHRKAAQ